MKVSVTPPADPIFVIEMNSKEIHILRHIAALYGAIPERMPSGLYNDTEIFLDDLAFELNKVSL